MKRFIWNYENSDKFEYGDPRDPLDHSSSKLPKPSDCRNRKGYPKIWKTIDRFLDDPDKPVVLLLARPAPEKNLVTMVETFGEFPEVAEKCNLVIVAGRRKDILCAKYGSGVCIIR